MKFEKLLKQRSQVDCELVKELFPEDEEFYQKIKELQESYTNKSSGEGGSGGSKDEKDLERKVEEYKNKLRQEIDAAIKEEKEKDEQRKKAYDQETNPSKKQQIEKTNAVERAKGNERIQKMQNDMDGKVKEYEQSLRN